MGRLTIFAKANLDVRDSLHSLRIAGNVLWNGINEVVRTRFPTTVVRIRHETWTRSDALLAAPGEMDDRGAPDAIRTHRLAEWLSRVALDLERQLGDPGVGPLGCGRFGHALISIARAHSGGILRAWRSAAPQTAGIRFRIRRRSCA